MVKSIFINGEIWKGEISADLIHSQIQGLAADDELEVYINSPGGSVFEGLAIYNILSELKQKKTIKIVGIAASMASVIACAKNANVLIADSAMMLVHNPWGISLGDSRDMKKTMAELDMIKAEILKIYVDKTGKTKDEISALMDEDNLLDSSESVAWGFANATYTPGKEEVKAMQMSYMKYAALLRNQDTTNIKSDKDLENNKIHLLINGKVEIMDATQLEIKYNDLQRDFKDLQAKYETESANIKNLQTELNQIKADKTELETKFKALETEKNNLTQENAKFQESLIQSEEKAFCEKLCASAKLARTDVENTATKLIGLRKAGKAVMFSPDKTMYDYEKETLEARTPAVSKDGVPIPQGYDPNKDTTWLDAQRASIRDIMKEDE